jgi:hypothetical protein
MKVMLASRPKRLEQPPLPSFKPATRFIQFCFELVTGAAFDRVIMAAILGNLLVMACNHYGATPEWELIFYWANIFFTFVFAAECLLKLVGLGVRQYFDNMWCRFDFLLVLGSIASLVASLGGLGALFRIFRIGRVLRLVRFSPGLSRLLRTLIISLPSLGNVAGLLFLVIYVFAIIAMNLFSGMRYGGLNFFNRNDANFDSFHISYMLLFRAMTGENWNGCMHELMLKCVACAPGRSRALASGARTRPSGAGTRARERSARARASASSPRTLPARAALSRRALAATRAQAALLHPGPAAWHRQLETGGRQLRDGLDLGALLVSLRRDGVLHGHEHPRGRRDGGLRGGLRAGRRHGRAL